MTGTGMSDFDWIVIGLLILVCVVGLFVGPGGDSGLPGDPTTKP